MKILFAQALLVSVLLFGCHHNNQEQPDGPLIGNYYADVLHGITFMYDNNQAFLFRIGYINDQNNYVETYKEHESTLPDHSGQKFTASAPDYSYNKFGYTTDSGNVVWIVWSAVEDEKIAVGKIFSENPREIFLEVMQAWPDAAEVYYSFSKDGFSGKLRQDENGINWSFEVLNKPSLGHYAALDSSYLLSDQIIQDIATNSETKNLSSAAIKYKVSKNEPLYFIAGKSSKEFSIEQIEKRLKSKHKTYLAERFAIKTPFGEIWEPVSNHLNSSRVYGTQTKSTAHVVSRGWCNGYNQRLFEWDSFFQGMLASIEDPEGGRATIRSILAHQTPIGIVPNNNFGNDTINNSNDRSQPPVGAICVWKMHQYHPDNSFLKEVYPKLLKWHNWWFDIRPENGLPYRDGNQNGLLEWGSEKENFLQGAKYESGQDNSPMFDEVIYNKDSRTMELDMAGLSGLWAADALYLSYIAQAIGKNEDATTLKNQALAMNDRLNETLWNDAKGMYCNKYWSEYSRYPKVSAFKELPANILSDEIEVSYQDENGNKVAVQSEKIGLNNSEMKKTGLMDRKADKYVREENPVNFKFSITPQESRTYFFYTPEEFGVWLSVNGNTIIDNRKFWITEFISAPVTLEEGREYEMELYYTGDIPFELKWSKAQKFEGSLFSDRLGPTLFYPLIAGAPTPAQAEKVIKNLLDTTLFWGNYVLPTIARDDPEFGKGYWRGRIWPPTNYLAYLGIDNYAPDEVTWQYAVMSARQAQGEWKSRGHLYENYYSDGPGAGDPHYCWGGLMQLIMLEELAGIDNENGEITRNPSAKGNYDILNFPLSNLN